MGAPEIKEEVMPPGNTEAANAGRPTPCKRQRLRFLRQSTEGARWLFASPAEWFGLKTIRSNAASIGQTYDQIRAPRARDRRFKTNGDRGFDMVSTAFAYGISVEELERRLAARRRQSAFLAYVLFGLGCALGLAWAWVALRTATGGGRAILLIQFLPFLDLFY